MDTLFVSTASKSTSSLDALFNLEEHVLLSIVVLSAQAMSMNEWNESIWSRIFVYIIPPYCITSCDKAHGYFTHYLSRCIVGVEVLNELNCVKSLIESKEQMKKDHNEKEYSNIDFIQSITYALLVEADEIKQNFLLADQVMCYILEQLISLILKMHLNVIH
ncbi:unnamed protein product [Adineta steineri]|uniref:Uncharacterized protein n=1 Tax=Adineta steineri TaxID=433720 RepID=A0A814M8K2_9BILA|nr:unnamed protein product [Adineta steineri]CAF1162973.1 unnamed protein product [Adineta steineri]